MVTHWESSRRPLYVRTIWKDGQHHVILDKTKETQPNTTASRRLKQCMSSSGTHRITKSAGAGINLKVSSVRVMLSGINTIKSNCKKTRGRDKSLDRPKTWTQPISNRTLPCTDLNKEVNFATIQGFRPSNLNKSNLIETSLNQTEKYEVNILDNALSERVMIWLDLAIQNCKMDKNCTVTAEACNLSQNPTFNNDSVEENIIVESSILKKTSPRQDDKHKEEIIIYSNEEVDVPQDDHFYHILSPSSVSSEEYTFKEQPIEEKEDSSEKKVNCVKRQLHIFMPNLPKRGSDCDSSIISSKISIN